MDNLKRKEVPSSTKASVAALKLGVAITLNNVVSCVQTGILLL